jgi:hypothetical protein
MQRDGTLVFLTTPLAENHAQLAAWGPSVTPYSPRGGRLLGNGVEERDCVGVGVSRRAGVRVPVHADRVDPIEVDVEARATDVGGDADAHARLCRVR